VSVVTVERGGGGELAFWMDEAAQALAVDVLEVLIAVAEEALSHAGGDERQRARERLQDVGDLRRQAREATGPIHMVAEEELIIEAIRAIASHGAYELDVLLEALAGTRAPLGEQAVEMLHARSAAAAGAVEALIACEANRREA
jgi:hypothetical protein